MTEETLFHEVLALPPAERSAFLDGQCAGLPQLRAAVEALLAAHDASGSLLDQREMNALTGEFTPEPAALPTVTVYARPSIEAGLVIAGRYTLLEKIGEGGMGEVWIAKQSEPVKRKVAVKLIKTGMDSKVVLARFEQERQALALMDHPNIAKVLDGGLTDDRRPYFVMELVNGLPLNRYCDEAKLTPRERLELFVPVCQAVQHAHQKGIVHRDLKPSNILITLYDGKPVPKVIDFGVAKATGGKLTDESLSTQFGAVVGTLEYMAPEQAGFATIDVDTRADIYSLGIILYELLTGLRPFDAKRLRQAALDEVIRILREEEPSKPSTRLSTDDALPSHAASRQTEPKKLMALLRGELDWIVMKCLEKSRERRYETANALSRDIQRFLADEPVEARPASFGYRASKFLRRHKGPVVAVGLLLLTLISGIIGTTWGLLEAKHQQGLALDEAVETEKARRVAVNEAAEKEKARKAEAEQRAEADTQRHEAKKAQGKAEAERAAAQKERNLAVAARKEADRQRALADEVNKFLQNDLLLQADSEFQMDNNYVPDPNLTVRTALDRAAKRIGDRFKDQPLVEAGVRVAIGKAYSGVGDARLAVTHLQRAVALRQEHLGKDERDTLVAMYDLAHALYESGQQQAALDMLHVLVKLQETKLGPGHVEVLSVRNTIAFFTWMTGQVAPARTMIEENLRQWEKTAPEAGGRLIAMDYLAQIHISIGQPKRALAILDEMEKIAPARFSPKDSPMLKIQAHRGMAYHNAGQFDLAANQFEKVLKITRLQMGPDHPDSLSLQYHLALAWLESKRNDPAMTLLEKTLTQSQEKLGLDHPHTLLVMSSLAAVYRSQGEVDRPSVLLQQTLEGMKKRYGPEHPTTLTGMANLADAYIADGRLDEAIALCEKALVAWKKQPADHPHRKTCLNNLAVAYSFAGREAEATRILEDLVKNESAQFGPNHPLVVERRNNLASLRRSTQFRDFDKALAAHGPDHRITQIERLKIAERMILVPQRVGGADYHLRKLLDAWGGKETPFEEGLIFVLNYLTEIQSLKRRHPEAEKLARRSLALCEKYREPKSAWLEYWTQSLLGGGLTGQEKFVEAEKFVLAGCNGLLESPAPAPHHKTIMPKACKRVIDLYDAWDKKDEAAKWRQKLAKFIPANAEIPSYPRVYDVGMGLQLKGRLNAKTTKLIYQVNLKAGMTYVIDMISSDPKALDPYLILADSKGVKLAEDDDGGGGLNARITFRAVKDGAYRIVAASFGPAGNGEFTLTVRAGGAAVKAKGRTADELLKEARADLPPNSVQLAVKLAELGYGLLQKKEPIEAEKLIAESLLLHTKLLPKHWGTFSVKSLLGEALLAQKKYADAEQLLIDGYEGLMKNKKSIPPQGLQHLTLTDGRLAALFQATREKSETKLQGSLTEEEKEQIHEVNLTKGKFVVIEMRSQAFDTYLRLEDLKGGKLAENDDIDLGAKNLDSRIVVRLTEEAAYRVIATSFQNQGRGRYEIVIREYAERLKEPGK
jgi:tetratricopeptide (TPR) repeat protein/tRNA A-37 threonylcarbamoyl transferase component Bud32